MQHFAVPQRCVPMRCREFVQTRLFFYLNINSQSNILRFLHSPLQWNYFRLAMVFAIVTKSTTSAMFELPEYVNTTAANGITVTTTDEAKRPHHEAKSAMFTTVDKHVPARDDDLVKNHWHAVPFGADTRYSYLLTTRDEVAAGSTINVHVKGESGKVTVFAGTIGDLRTDSTCEMVVEAHMARQSERVCQFKVFATSQIRIVVESQNPAAQCRVKYTIDKCAPTNYRLVVGDHWRKIPLHDTRCFYILATDNKVSPGTLKITGKAIRGTMTVFTGEYHDIQTMYLAEMTLDAAHNAVTKFRYDVKDTAKRMYIGIEPLSPDAFCLVQVKLEKHTTKTLSTAAVTATEKPCSVDMAVLEQGNALWMVPVALFLPIIVT